jgi:hypothetical protein
MDQDLMKTLPLHVMPVYAWCLEHGQISRLDYDNAARDLKIDITAVESAVDALMSLRLLYPVPGSSGVLTAASPDTALSEVVEPIEIDIARLNQRATATKKNILSFRKVYYESRERSNRQAVIDLISGVNRVRSTLSEEVRRCTSEVLCSHPGIFSDQAIEASIGQDLEMLARGVRMRSLFQHPVRVNASMRKLLEQLTEAGGEIRTCEEIVDRAIVFDREVAFLRNRLGPTGAVVVREPSTVDFIHRSLEQAWSMGLPYTGGNASDRGYGIAADEVKLAIIRILASGAKDDMIARRLGMSVRTCRRHIAEIMNELQASSRFQAGVNAMSSRILTDVVSQ